MKVLLLAFDGLEYNLVVKLRLKNVTQKVYGYLDISEFYVKEVDEILTPNI